MGSLLPGIRNAVRAFIVRDEKVLLLRKDGYPTGGERYALPGGAQEHGETLEQALQRECLEEIGTEVRILDLLHLADWFKQRETDPPSRRQLLECLFVCEVPDGYTPRNGHRPDKHQVEVVWVALDELHQITLLPASMRERLTTYPKPGAVVYLGRVD